MWYGSSRLLLPVLRPAGLFSGYVASALAFRTVMKRKDYADWMCTGFGVGWTSMFFGRALTGRPWLLVAPAAISTGLLVAGAESLYNQLIEGSLLSSGIGSIPLDNWLIGRWKYIAQLEARLSALNTEIHALSRKSSVDQ